MGNQKIYIGGEWVASSSDDSIPVINPFTEEVVAEYPAGTPEDVDAAVGAAKSAFRAWSLQPIDVRTQALREVARLIGEHQDELARLASTDVGTPIRYTRGTLDSCIFILNNMADNVQSLDLEERRDGVAIVLEPIGVIGAITPWNYPIYQSIIKIAPAIGSGCTVVLKPSEVAPLSVFRLVELIDEAKILPPGVLNLVTGAGPVVGEAIAAHPDVAMVTLTGSGRAGARVSQLAATTIKRVTLELGGKSPNLVLPDVENLSDIVTRNIGLLASNAGQTCTALTRLIVPRERLEEAENAAKTALESLVAGDPLDDSTTIGPIVSEQQRDRVMSYITGAEADGVVAVAGGSADHRDGNGFFVPATVFSNVTSDMVIAQEEIFGPVLAIMPYDSLDEAVDIANSTNYGLSGSVWGADKDAAVGVARRIQSGMVHVNGAPGAYDMPFGGYKQSGNGKELGTAGLMEFYETKSIAL